MRRPWLRAGFLAFLLLLCFSPAASADGSLLNIEAESLEVAADGAYIRAEGNVVLTYGEFTLRADAAVCHDKKVEAAGSVSLTSPTADLHAARLSVDLASGAVAGEEIEGKLDGCFIKAAALKPTRSGGRELEETSLTRCDLAIPCYEFRAASIAIEGRRITIHRAWLVLRGRRLIPLPQITLDLDRIEEWPELSAGCDERGLYLEGSFTAPLRPGLDLVLQGALGTASGVSLELALPWRPGGGMEIEPWLGWSSSAGAADFGLTLTGPSRAWGGGTAAFRTYGRWGADGPEAGATLQWSRPLSRNGNGALGLDLGWRSTPAGSGPLLALRFSSSRRISAHWDLGFSCAYDLAGGAWEKAEISAVRYFHCYFARLDLDLLQGASGLSGGIRF